MNHIQIKARQDRIFCRVNSHNSLYNAGRIMTECTYSFNQMGEAITKLGDVIRLSGIDWSMEWDIGRQAEEEG